MRQYSLNMVVGASFPVQTAPILGMSSSHYVARIILIKENLLLETKDYRISCQAGGQGMVE